MTYVKPVDVPAGFSPNLQNVRLIPRAVQTRPGLTARVTKASVTFFGLAQFIDNLGNRFLFTLDSNGSLDNSTSLTPVAMQANLFNAGSLLANKTAFGRNFLAGYADGAAKAVPQGPVRYSNAQFDSVFPPAVPGGAPSAADGAASTNGFGAGTVTFRIVFETAAGVLSQAGAAFSYVAAGGKQATLSGIPTGPSYVVARRILILLGTLYYTAPQYRLADNVSTTFSIDDGVTTINGYLADALTTGPAVPPMPHLSPDGPGGAPTAADSATAGSVVSGVHQVQVVFETRFGYLTAPSPAASWTAAGGKKALITNIPVGPWYVTARRLLFTAAGGADFFYLSASFRIADNATTSLTVDFTDLALLQGTNFNSLTRNFATPPESAVGAYNGRLTAWGGLNTIKGTNLGFDGGWALSGASIAPPLGWTADAVSAPGGNKEFLDCYAGESWKITGNGATALRGMILNASLQPLLALGTAYSVSVRAKINSTLLQGNLTVDLQSTSLNAVLGTFTVNFASLTTSWQEFTGTLTTGLASIPADLVLRVYGSNTPTNNGTINVDHLLVYPSNAAYEASVLRVSNPFDPETFDGINGFLQVTKDDGQRIMACVQLRSFYYIFKERSMHVTVDDGVNPPSLWLLREIDSTVGAASPNAVASTESFLAVASRSGAYVFMGGRPIKVSQEIQTTWEKIDWSLASKIHVMIDPQRKRIFFFAPFTGSTAPQNCLLLDYSEGMGDEDNPAGRKWALDLYPQNINASLRLESSSNQQTFYFATNKVDEHAGTDDDGTAIDSFYETAFMKAGDRGQDLYGGVAVTVEGSGTLTTSLKSLDDAQVTALANITLAAAPGKQFELYGNLESERAHVRCETNALGAFFTLKALTLYGMPWSEARPL